MRNELYWVLTLLLTAVFAVPFWSGRARDGHVDRFTPDRIAAVLLAIRVIPFYASAAFAGLRPTLNEWVRSNPGLPNPDAAALQFGVLQAIGFAFLLAGIRSIRSPRLADSRPNAASRPGSPSLLNISLLFAAAGMGVFVLFLRKVGTITFILENLAERSGLQAGQGYLTHTYVFLLSMGALISIASLAQKRTPARGLLVGAIFLLSAAAITATGGRSFFVQLTFLAVLVWHYCVHPITRIRPGFVAVAAAVALYVVTLPVLRAPGGYQLLRNDASEFSRQVVTTLPELAAGNAYTDTQIFIVGHFNPGNVWGGASFLGLLTAPIPRTMYPDKPPVDDGVYIFSLIQGIDARPPMPAALLSVSAWPPSTFGTMYMNFWIPGVLAGMYLLGLAYGLAYRAMRKSGYGLVAAIAYGVVMWRFQLSNLHLVLTFHYLLLLLPLALILRARSSRTPWAFARYRRVVGNPQR